MSRKHSLTPARGSRLSPADLDLIIETLNGRFAKCLAGYDERKYPADAYALIVKAFAAPSDTSDGDIERALKWKYGHWRKLNYPAQHREMARRIAARWRVFRDRADRDPRAIFDFWTEALQGRTTQPFITVTFLLHLLRPAGFPIIDQHTFRAMNHLLRSVWPDWQGKGKPSTYADLMTYTEFFNRLHSRWATRAGAPSRLELDKGLMVFGQELKRERSRTCQM